MKQKEKGRWINSSLLLIVYLLFTAIVALPVAASSYTPMMTGENGHTVSAAFTVGEYVGDYQPIGILTERPLMIWTPTRCAFWSTTRSAQI